jgi:pimeloyl-ACP methyl ester carboxylesterase
MHSQNRLRKWALAGLLLIACALLVNPLMHAVFAVRLAVSFQRLASGSAEQFPGVKEARIRRRMGTQDCEALLYYPANSPPTSAMVLVAGLSELGCYHPRLKAFSRLLADKGMMVITPDIREFREFQISPEPIRQILFWHNEVPKLEGGDRVQTTGLAGISFSGTLALIAATRPEIREKVGFVVAIGPYSSLIRCTRNWFAAGPVTVSGDYYPTRFYAKWIVMLAALDMLESGSDRTFLRGVLHNLLIQKNVPPAGADLTSDGKRWYALATMKEAQSDPELSQRIEQHLVSHIYPELDPEEALRNLRCPAFFIHGAYDDLIPPEESIELHKRISHSYLLISPFLTHTHPTDKELSLIQKARAALDAVVFSYHLSKVIR